MIDHPAFRAPTAQCTSSLVQSDVNRQSVALLAQESKPIKRSFDHNRSRWLLSYVPRSQHPGVAAIAKRGFNLNSLVYACVSRW
jgi:hypothetical protein